MAQLEDDNQSVKTVLVPTYINYRNSEIGNSDSDFATGTPYFFFRCFSDGILRNSGIGSGNSDSGPPSKGCGSSGIPNQAIAKEVVLAYPDFSKVFEIYTDASSKQLRAVITQDNRPIAFFSRKLSPAQRKYSVTKIELLAIVKTLKEF